MAPVTQRRFANLDDDDDLYDPAYPGLKVVRDGGRIRVPIQLTDGMPPEWMRPPRRPVFDASAHRPRFAVVDASDPHVQAAERAYRGTQRLFAGRMARPGHNGAACPEGRREPKETLTSGVTADPNLSGRRLAKPILTTATTTLRLFASSGFPLARHPAPALAIATRGLLFHKKRRRRTRPTPTPNMSTASPMRGGDDRARGPCPPAGPGAGRADRRSVRRGCEVSRCQPTASGSRGRRQSRRRRSR